MNFRSLHRLEKLSLAAMNPCGRQIEQKFHAGARTQPVLGRITLSVKPGCKLGRLSAIWLRRPSDRRARYPRHSMQIADEGINYSITVVAEIDVELRPQGGWY